MRAKDQMTLTVEALEDKRLLAGDVSVAVVDGSLLVRGDAESNGVAITSGDAPGSFVVAGLPTGDAATTINGSTDRLTVDGVRRGIRMVLGEGDDVANVFRANVRGGVVVSAGLGDDVVNIGGMRGDDGEPNSLIGGPLVADLGPGDDGLRVGGTGIGEGVQLRAGEGHDHVTIANSVVRGISHLGLGAGEDSALIEQSRMRFVRVGGGLGADQVGLIDAHFTGVSVDLGDGDDLLAVDGVRARRGWFQGGEGEDGLRVGDDNRFGQLRVAGFESRNDGPGATDAGSLIDDVFAEEDTEKRSLTVS